MEGVCGCKVCGVSVHVICIYSRIKKGEMGMVGVWFLQGVKYLSIIWCAGVVAGGGEKAALWLVSAQ